MRKLDTLVLRSFIGPFILTTLVATFILLIQYMLKYFDDFVGKNLGFSVFAELIFYFSLNMLQVALPLGVLVSSLMTFGNLGENFELTAIKGAGISLIRALRPIFFFVVVLTVGAFNFNNYVVPAANLKAYSLLYDIKHKKPALDIKEGVFYRGIPDYSINVKEKLGDNRTLRNVMIYDHTEGIGNNRVILADSSRMYTIYNDKYLKLELYDGNYYSEQPKEREPVDQFFRTRFHRMDMVFSLSSFDLKRTKEELFQNNRQMKNIAELTHDIDSLNASIFDAKRGFFVNAKGFFSYHMDDFELKKENPFLPKPEKEVKPERKDGPKAPAAASLFIWPLEFGLAQEEDTVEENTVKEKKRAWGSLRLDSVNHKLPQLPAKEKRKTQVGLPEASGRPDFTIPEEQLAKKKEEPVVLDSLGWDFLNDRMANREGDILQTAKNQAQNIKVNLSSVYSRVDNLTRDVNKFVIEKYKKYSQAFACIVMFLIGAPLGAIIKKGGLGVPVIVSIIFFIFYYVVTIISEKWAKEGLMDPVLAVWIADISLLPIGLFFLRQARVDARLFDTDFYNVWLDKMKERYFKR